MLFSSTVFIFLFLPLVSVIYFFMPQHGKNAVLLAASLLFYAWGEPRYVLVMLAVCLVSWAGGLLVASLGESGQGGRQKFALAVFIFLDMAALLYFKYANFILANISRFLTSPPAPLDVVMPIGISFFTFQAVSYLVDVYRREVAPQRSLFALALYISFFPQLIAGPIVKYHDVSERLKKREIVFGDVVSGLKRFCLGLAKKMLLANQLGEVADTVFDLGMEEITFPIAWIGAVFYSLQLFFDFSGYSDMAIGLGQLFGFRFLENFSYPYISRSITEFWRRWHISLGTWFREYVYIPLGGNRRGAARNYLNLAIVFLLTGLWHGADWLFVAWGAWHGAFIIAERYGKIEQHSGNGWLLFRHIYTIFAFVVGWAMFRSPSFAFGLEYIGKMIGISGQTVASLELEYFCTTKNALILFLAITAATPLWKKYLFEGIFIKGEGGKTAENIWLVALFFLSVVYVVASTYNPFIYFRF